MEPKLIARLLAGGRIAVGLAMFLAPATAGRRWIGEPAGEPGTTVAFRAFGARDVALGVGTLAALDAGRDATGWIDAGIIADVGDAAGTLLARDALPGRAAAGVVAVASGAAALGGWLRGALAS